MELKYVPCNVCSNKEWVKINTCRITRDDADMKETVLALARCKKCGLVFVNPQPVFSKEELANLYSGRYFTKDYMKFYAAQKGNAVQSNESFSFRLSVIAQFKAAGRLLEVGCATGEFLHLAESKGWEVMGVELSDYAANIASQRYGLDIRRGTLEETVLPADYFDVIVAGDILEHIPDPKGFLTEVKRILKDDGILYLALPDFGSFHYWLVSFIARFTHKNYFLLPYHLYHFSGVSLSRLLETAGFCIKQKIFSQSKCSEKGIRGLGIKIIFLFGLALHMPDRIAVIAKKSGEYK